MSDMPNPAFENNLFFTRWLKGIPYEVAFWSSFYGSGKRRRELFSWSGYGKPCELDCFDVQTYMSALDRPDPLMIDLGCALSYAVGNLFPGKPEARVDYVDPLAPFYNRILDRHHIDRPRIRFGMIEGISGFYPEESVDLIHVRNALDHCADPMAGIIQSLGCLRVGGVLYLNHFRDEAVSEGYRGFHQWNISIVDHRLIIWNQEARIDVAQRLGDAASVETAISPQGRMVAVITKKRACSSTAEAYEAAREATERMMEAISWFHYFPNSISYQLARLWTFSGHTFMKLMPRALVDKIKSLLKKKES